MKKDISIVVAVKYYVYYNYIPVPPSATLIYKNYK